AMIVHATIDLGHNLGLEVIGEGVESEAIYRRLADLGCDVVQGYFLTRPIPADEFAAWLRDTTDDGTVRVLRTGREVDASLQPTYRRRLERERAAALRDALGHDAESDALPLDRLVCARAARLDCRALLGRYAGSVVFDDEREVAVGAHP